MKSWKTTAAGVLAIIASIAMALSAQWDGDPATIANWAALGPAIVAAVGLLFARDNDRTSEETGASSKARERSLMRSRMPAIAWLALLAAPLIMLTGCSTGQGQGPARQVNVVGPYIESLTLQGEPGTLPELVHAVGGGDSPAIDQANSYQPASDAELTSTPTVSPTISPTVDTSVIPGG